MPHWLNNSLSDSGAVLRAYLGWVTVRGTLEASSMFLPVGSASVIWSSIMAPSCWCRIHEWKVNHENMQGFSFITCLLCVTGNSINIAALLPGQPLGLFPSLQLCIPAYTLLTVTSAHLWNYFFLSKLINNTPPSRPNIGLAPVCMVS